MVDEFWSYKIEVKGGNFTSKLSDVLSYSIGVVMLGSIDLLFSLM